MKSRRWRRPITNLARSDSGMAMVEWAMVASFFAVVLMGVVDLGLAAQHKMQLANAVRVGMQYATVRKPIQGDLTQVTASVNNAAPPDTSGERSLTVAMYCKCPDGSDIACTDVCAIGDRRAYVSIALEDVYIPILSVPGTSNQYTLRADGTVRLN